MFAAPNKNLGPAHGFEDRNAFDQVAGSRSTSICQVRLDLIMWNACKIVNPKRVFLWSLLRAADDLLEHLNEIDAVLIFEDKAALDQGICRDI